VAARGCRPAERQSPNRACRPVTQGRRRARSAWRGRSRRQTAKRWPCRSAPSSGTRPNRVPDGKHLVVLDGTPPWSISRRCRAGCTTPRSRASRGSAHRRTGRSSWWHDLPDGRHRGSAVRPRRGHALRRLLQRPDGRPTPLRPRQHRPTPQDSSSFMPRPTSTSAVSARAAAYRKLASDRPRLIAGPEQGNSTPVRLDSEY
jgi:hypothetical protein